MAYTCHPKLQGRLRLGGWWFKASPPKKVCETLSQWKKAVITAMMGSLK
jgi:hypothetical protein